MDLKKQMLQRSHSVVCLLFPDGGGVSLLGAALTKSGSHVRYSIITIDEFMCDLVSERKKDNDAKLCDLLFDAIIECLDQNRSPIILLNERNLKFFLRLCRQKRMRSCLKDHTSEVVVGVCDGYSGAKVSEATVLKLRCYKHSYLRDAELTFHPGPRFIDEVATLYLRCHHMSSYERYLYFLQLMSDNYELMSMLSVYFTSDFSRFLMPNRKLHSN